MDDSSPTVVSFSRLPAGKVLTVVEHDLAVAYDLGEICRHSSQLGDNLVVDTSAMTFCDTTLFNFLGCIGERLKVTVRHPTRLYLDLLALCEREETALVSRPA
jgi:hypothetical protein